jgi:RNA 2',3'-cyclic 3'-phosphodiesterase
MEANPTLVRVSPELPRDAIRRSVPRVAKERLKSPRARLFVALDLPGWVREGLARWQREELTGERALRPGRPETLHVTLAFLGYQAEKAIGQIAEAAFGVPTRAPLLELAPEPVAVPRNRPRLFAVDAHSAETMALQAAVSDGLESAGFYEPERRPFWPHITVARVRSEKGKRQPMRVKEPPGALPADLCRPFRGVRVTLYRSILKREGAEYVPEAQLELLPDD